MSYLQTMVVVGLVSMALGCGGRGGAAQPVNNAGTTQPVATGAAGALTVVNQSSYDIYYLYMSSTADPNWGPDQLGQSTILHSGSSFSLQNVPCGNYDIKLVDEDGDACEIRNAYMCSNSALIINNDQLLSCEGYGN